MRSEASSQLNKGLAIALIALFAVSAMSTIVAIASAESNTGLPSKYTVSWNKESPSSSSNWTWTNIQWIYGPTISVDVAYLNGTSLINPSGGLPTHYLRPGIQFYVNITVPKSLFELGRNVSQISFDMNKYQSYYNGTYSIGLWSANLHMSYFAYTSQVSSGPDGSGKLGGSGGYRPSDPWNFQSSFWNYTNTPLGGSAGPPGPYRAPPAIFIPNRAASRFIEAADYYSVWFQGQLNESISVSGTFWYYFSVSDTKGSMVNSNGNHGGSIVVNAPDPTYGYEFGGTYTSYRTYLTDMNDKETGLVTPGTQFKVVFEFTGPISKVKNVSVFLSPPVDSTWWSNSTKNSRYLLEYTPKSGYQWQYNYSSSTWEYVNGYIMGSRVIRLTLGNVSTKQFNIDEGFQYWSFTSPGWGNWSSTFEKNVTGSSNFYALNSSASQSATSAQKIAFIVKIPESANASAGTYFFNHVASGTDGSRINGWGDNQFQILGSNSVTFGLIKETSNDPILRIAPGKYFRAVMRIEGTSEFRSIVTGHTTNITFQFGSPSTFNWKTVGSIDYSNTSYLQFLITRDSLSSVTYVEVFNYSSSSMYNRDTGASNYTSSMSKVNENDYVQIGQNGFTTEYNSSTNVLSLIFNLTFKDTRYLPKGYYWWHGYLANKTNGGWYDYYQWSSDPRISYTELGVVGGKSIMVGNTDSYWSWWSVQQTWSVDPLNGALDLDGNNMTKNDQFYVKSTYSSTSYWTQSGERMTVDLQWDKYNMHSYFALTNNTWHYEWSQLYQWYYPNNRSVVPHDRFVSLINNTIWDQEDSIVRPEYSQISSLTLNMTWDRIKAEYSKYSWWTENYNWYWLDINFNQNFFTGTQYGGGYDNLFFQYAGLLLFNDTNNDGVLNMGFQNGVPQADELTHYFIFEDAKSIVLMTPFPGKNGTQQVDVKDVVSWGVSVLGLNGTTYPTKVGGYSGFAGLGWWWHDSYRAYTPSGNFSTIPSRVGIRDLTFNAHFSIPNANLTAGATNEVRVKIDEGVGPWTLYDQPQRALANYSMAIAFLASSMNWQYSFQTTGGKNVTTDSASMSSDYYNVTRNGVKLADIQMGGAYYTWSKDGHNYTMHSSTTPMSAFQAMYSAYSMTGKGAASMSSFSMTGSNYFVTSAFKHWDGYGVVTDPYFAVFQSSQSQQGPVLPGGLSPVLIAAIAGIAVVVAAIFVLKRRHRSANIPKARSDKAEAITE